LEGILEPEKESASPPSNSLWLLAFLGILGVASWFPFTISDSINQTFDTVDRDDGTYHGTDDSRDYPTRGIGFAKTNSHHSVVIPKKKTKRWWKRWKPWVFLLNLATFVALAYYACITRRMWIEMQGQTRIQREAAINSERAWVGSDGPIAIDVLETMPQLKVESHYSIKNFGHGPAFKVFPYGMFWDDPKLYENVARNACTGPIEFATGTLPVGPQVRNPGPLGYTLFTNQTHAETMGSPSDPWQGAGAPDLKHFWFIGCIAYLDQFKSVHWTRFCMEPNFSPQDFNKGTPLQFCALYNDAGDGEPPK
jgi:hypothetical protein